VVGEVGEDRMIGLGKEEDLKIPKKRPIIEGSL